MFTPTGCGHLIAYVHTHYSVPARLGKGQGAKEIGHNLARERPKFWHNLVRERHIIGHSLEREWPEFGRNPAHERNKVWAQFCGRSMKTWAQICKHFTSIFTPLTENTKTAIKFCIKKKLNFFFFFCIRAARCIIGQSASQYGQGALRNMASWNTRHYVHTDCANRLCSQELHSL